MVLHVLIFLLPAILAQTVIYEGKLCNLTDSSPGVCTSVSNCPSILEELMAGNVPDKICGYTNLEPILCCPTSTPTTKAPPLPAVTKEPVYSGSWVNENQSDQCNLNNGSPGICTILKDCGPVVEGLKVLKPPDKLCGFNGTQPIICCPSPASMSSTTTTAPPVVTEERVNHGPGSIAKQKCTEYSKYVYSLKYPPMLQGFQKPINISYCRIKSQVLVTGGVKAESMEFPHMVAIGYNLKTAGVGWYCSGTLISETFVLTAAHCTNLPERGDAVWVRLGDLNLARSDDGAMPLDRRIIEMIRHFDYKPPSQYHDIALLRLEFRVSFNGWIRPACLHTAPSTEIHKAIATGWGAVQWNNNEESSDLVKVIMPFVDQQTCNASYTSGTTDNKLPNGVNETLSICAGAASSTDTCQDDSGGPLVIYSEPEYYCMYDVVGITSLRKSCGSRVPGVYTRVYNYISWIENTVWQNHT